MKKIGIIGGTFNPIHLAHLAIARAALTEANLDKILFIPSGCSYLKDPDEIASADDRIAMVRLAIANIPAFELSTIEVDRQGNSYTFETLEELHRIDPDAEYYLIMGADNLFTMKQWIAPERIFDACTILVTIRGDKDDRDVLKQISYLQQKYQTVIRKIPFEKSNISSTSIREKCKGGHSITNLVPENVAAYIQEHGLYCAKH